jgi:CHAD domain-containing protein
LVRSELKPKDFQRLNSCYRTIGQQLSPLRDATVLIKTLQKLREAQPASVSPKVFARLHQVLVDEQSQKNSQFFDDETQINQVTCAFRQASQQEVRLSKRHKGFQAMAPNLETIYRRARKAYKKAKDEPSIHHFHELRKDVKTIWYHTRLLQPIWPDLFKAYAHEFDRLGELLGNDHDFGVLAQLIESDERLIRNKPTKEKIVQGLHEQRAQLQEQIYPLATRLLAEKARLFVKRFRLHWKTWQAEARQPSVDSLQTA